MATERYVLDCVMFPQKMLLIIAVTRILETDTDDRLHNVIAL